MRSILPTLLFLVVMFGEAAAQTRDEMVRKDLSDLRDDPTWTYNDLEAGFAEAKRSGKPLFVVLRCIP